MPPCVICQLWPIVSFSVNEANIFNYNIQKYNIQKQQISLYIYVILYHFNKI